MSNSVSWKVALYFALYDIDFVLELYYRIKELDYPTSKSSCCL